MSGVLSLVRFGEIGLKGGNRHEFLRRLAQNLRRALAPHSGASVESAQGRLIVRHGSAARAEAEAAARVFGVTSVSPAQRIERDAEAICRAAVSAAESAARRCDARSFRVTTRRADKRFPLRSMEIDALAGAAVRAALPRLRVDLGTPDLTIGIEIRDEGAYVFEERIPGPGGLPCGSLGRALALLSGGIDSPVAAHLARKRGLEVEAVFFHSGEFVGDAPLAKVKELARLLSRFDSRIALHVVPFGPIQVAIQQRTEEAYRNILYRRMMHRIAVRIARPRGLAALVTGDNLGQVASQTLENLELTAAASELPVLRPLITFDKEEIVALARRIGTYEASIVPAPDCCTLFQPARPRIRGVAREAEENERRLEVDDLVAAAVPGLQTWVFRHGDPGVLARSASSVAGGP